MTAPAPSPDPERAYRNALGCYATGVTVVTADVGGTILGITVNSFTSVSLRPRLILWCLDDQADRYLHFSETELFGVNVLAADQQALSRRFAGDGPFQLAAREVEITPQGPPLLPRALARFACRTTERKVAGDHLVVFGEVLAFDHRAGDGLTYFRGRYGLAGAPED